MKSKRCLITGGSGFIGANLVRKLIKGGSEVTIIVRKKSNLWRLKDVLDDIELFYCDVTDPDRITKCVKMVKPEIVYHLATFGAYSRQTDESKILSTNIFGTLNLINACRHYPPELFVNTGSSSEYGFKTKAMSEKDRTEPNSFYAISKVAQTNICEHLARQDRFPAVTLRPFSVYGPFEDPGRLISTLMLSVFDDRPINMVSPDTVRDFIYVDDYVAACLKTNELKQHLGQTYNVGTGTQTNFKKLIATYLSVLKINKVVNWSIVDQKKWDSTRWMADVSKSASDLNWAPKTTLEAGLYKTWQWFKINRHLYESN